MNEQQKSQRGQEIPYVSEEEAREFFEKQCWPDGPVCPHCESKESHALNGKGARPGLFYCKDCEGQYSVTVGTVMEDTHLPLATWLRAFHMMATNKKGVSALYLMRNLGLGSYRTAWHLAHRIRLAMTTTGPFSPMTGTVECDEAYVGGKTRGLGRVGGMKNKTPVVSLVERETGKKRSFVFANVTAKNLLTTIKEQTAETAEIHTDASSLYTKVSLRQEHHSVNHEKGEYVRYVLDPRKPGNFNTITTNLVESSFALLKRGIYGSFHHVSRKHLHRYTAEFDARWNLRNVTDTERRDEIVKGAKGKRLTYKTPIAGVKG